MAIAKASREQLDRLAAEMHSFLDRVDKSGNWATERETYHKMEADYTAMEDMINARERAEERAASLATAHSADGRTRIAETSIEELRDTYRLKPKAVREREERIKKDPFARAFNAYLRRPSKHKDGMNGMDAESIEFMNAQSTSTASQGGYLVPQGFSDQLEEAKKWFGGIDGTVGKFQTESGNPMPWPTVNDTANKGRILGQNVQSVETDLAFGSVTFNAYIGSSDLILVPDALITDSYFDLDALVAKMLGTRLGRLLNWKGTTGSGTNEPTGIVTAAVAAGNLLTLATGNTSSISYNNLVDLEHSVDPEYRYNPSSRWMFSDAVLKLLKKLVDSANRPLWQPALTSSFQQGATFDRIVSHPMILDHPYVINQDMATPAANQYTMLFGDLSTFKVREVAGGTTMLRLVERFAEYLQVGYTAFQRFDTNLVDAGTHPIAVLQQSAT